MEAVNSSAETLRNQITACGKQLRELKEQLAAVEAQGKALEQNPSPSHHGQEEDLATGEKTNWPLTQEEYSRYGRQMIVPSIGIKGVQ
jgi:adenylyltransferase/sulfurtransferase